MSENPYESPLTRNSVPVVNDPYSDRALARRLLEFRKHGYSFGLYVRSSGRQYLIFILYIGLLLAALAYLALWMLFFFMLGLLAGCIARDIGWVRATGKVWPFNIRVLDWEKVERLADE